MMNITKRIKKSKMAQQVREIKQLIRQLQRVSYLDHGRISYSQSGEDLLVDTVLASLGIATPTYLDVGAHHSRYLSNTFFFYCKGEHGVCVEPNPILCQEIQKNRHRDVCINKGVAFNDEEEADFYVMSESSLSTFSKNEAEHIQRVSPIVLAEIVRLPLISMNKILAQHFDRCPDFISIDAEGLDYAILTAIDFSLYRPAVICIETKDFNPGRTINKRNNIIDYLNEQQYFVYADTGLNSIFVDKILWLEG